MFNLKFVFSSIKVKKLDVSYMIHRAKLLLKMKNCPANHIFREKRYVFSKRTFLINANIEGTNKS